jgi:hypothetical protein
MICSLSIVAGHDMRMAELQEVIAKAAKPITYAPVTPSSPPPAKPYPLFPLLAFLRQADHMQIVRWLRAARVKRLDSDAVGDEIHRSGQIYTKGSALECLYITHFLDMDPDMT